MADRLAQQSICASLSRRFPNITIIGEEVSESVQLYFDDLRLPNVVGTMNMVLNNHHGCEVTDHQISFLTQELPAEEVQGDLIENGQSEEILKKSCPEEYKALKEEEVTTGFMTE